MDLAYIKNYLKIDYDEDNAYLTDLIQLSKNFIYEQTGVEYNSSDKIYEQALLFTIAHFYENRNPLSEKSVNQVPYTLRYLICHIGMRGALANNDNT